MMRCEELLMLCGLLSCMAGCCTECERLSSETGQPVQPAIPAVVDNVSQHECMVESASVDERTSVKVKSWANHQTVTKEAEVIGRVVCHGGVLSIQQIEDTSIAVRQSVVLCVLREQKLVPLASAVVTPESGLLRLDVRNVQDEDGDLVAVTDSPQVQDFRKNAVEYVARHYVVAVKIAFEGAKLK